MTAHIDTLKEWWENAEQGDPRRGDTIIQERGSQYMIKTVAQDWGETADERFTRILHRAPKPTPAWHDAIAVIAHTARFSERRPFALTHTEDVLDPYNTEWITRDDLIDPAPLIEAKVTDETARTVLDRYYETETGHDWPEDTIALMRLAVTAALGIEAT